MLTSAPIVRGLSNFQNQFPTPNSLYSFGVPTARRGSASPVSRWRLRREMTKY